MPQSPLQDAFMKELVLTAKASQARLARKLGCDESAVADELEGLCHGILVTFDGGSALADHGLVSIVDENGNAFDRNLHEQLPHYWQ